jgi:hypothetical protein
VASKANVTGVAWHLFEGKNALASASSNAQPSDGTNDAFNAAGAS